MYIHKTVCISPQHTFSEINIEEVVTAYKAGKLSEVFGTGTAAVIAPIKELNYKGYAMKFNTDNYKISSTVKSWLNDIREGKKDDKFKWMSKV